MYNSSLAYQCSWLLFWNPYFQVCGRVSLFFILSKWIALAKLKPTTLSCFILFDLSISIYCLI